MTWPFVTRSSSRTIGFGARALRPDDQPKYLNSPETPIYHKSGVLYGMSRARDSIRREGTVIVVETPAQFTELLCGDGSCPGDLNDDAFVDFADLLRLLSEWGKCPGCDADINEDGTVDFTDLLLLLNAWGPCG